MASTLLQSQQVFTMNVSKLIQYAYDNGYTLTFGEAYRPQFTQEYYYSKGLSRTRNSKHLLRLAVDFNIFRDNKLLMRKEDILKLGSFWKSLSVNNRWGGDFVKLADYGHFEYAV